MANIIDDEINITGSGASLECWYNGKIYQTLPARRTMETCVTFTYIQFCQRLWDLTGSNVYVDELERTIYKAMLGALKDDARRVVKNAKEKTAESNMESTDSMLMCLLLFQQSLNYKRLAEKLLDEMAPDAE